jgi:hypothetical protein
MRVSTLLVSLLVLSVGACATGEHLPGGGTNDRESIGGQDGGPTGTSGKDAGTASENGGAGAGGARTSNAGTAGQSTTSGGSGTVDASFGLDASTDGPTPEAGNGCIPGQKPCVDGLCWPQSPAHGCDLGPSCQACPGPPANGFAKCTGQECDFDCNSGYHRASSSCALGAGTGGATGSGGAQGSGGKGSGGAQSAGGASSGGASSGGASSGGAQSSGGTSSGGAQGSGGKGAGGAGPTCKASDCGGCIPFIQQACCKSNGSCGCKTPFVGSCN